MTTNNSQNSIFTNNSDGFLLGGGTTSRSLTVTSGNLTLSGGGSNTYTFPAATDTLVGRASTDTLTNKTITDSSNSIGGAALSGLYRFNTQAITTNTTQTGAIIKEGWSYINPSSGSTGSVAITFPTAFPNSVVQLQFGTLGFKSSPAPTVITDFNTPIGGETLGWSASSISISGFTINGYKTSAFSSSNSYYGMWWRATGT